MVSHHVLTLMLFSVAHMFNTQRMGLLILAIFNFSNPCYVALHPLSNTQRNGLLVLAIFNVPNPPMHAANVLHYGKPMKALEVFSRNYVSYETECAGRDMVAHHVLTLVLFSVAHMFNTQRMGLLILAIFNFSNPFMHTAKVLHYVKAMKALEVVTFSLFGLTFAISRCVAFPLLLRSIFKKVLERFQIGDQKVVIPALFGLVGLAALQLLQFYWLARIVRCARIARVPSWIVMFMRCFDHFRCRRRLMHLNIVCLNHTCALYVISIDV
jgi:hypothetical protein